MDKLNAISVFCKVVESQSFTQAAEQHQISVAMASKLVSQLEEQLKTRLLQRTTRKVSPTEAGTLYYQRCQPILLELEEAESSISNLATSLQGQLTISVPRDFGLRFIAPNLAQFIKAHPDLHINIEFNDRLVDLVSEGYDVALRIGHLQDSSLVARKIASSSIHFVASPAYLTQYGTPTRPEDLQHHHCLLYKSAQNLIYWQHQQGVQTQKVKMFSKVMSNNGLTLVELAKAGLGITNIPRFLVEKELKNGELVEVLADYPQQKIDLNMVYPHRRHLPAKTKAFIDFIQQLNFCRQTGD